MATISIKGKKSLNVDLTPMVDLNLLLITFFMMVTTLNNPKAMEINVPIKCEHCNLIPNTANDAVITFILGKDHTIKYYEGAFVGDISQPLHISSFKADGGIRDVLIQKQQQIQQLKEQGVLSPISNIVVIIKPDIGSTTEDVIHILDEMTINNITQYSLVDITEEEQTFIATK